MKPMVRNEKPIDRPAPSADQTMALVERSSSSSPSSRMSSWIISAEGGVGADAGLLALVRRDLGLRIVGAVLGRRPCRRFLADAPCPVPLS